MIKQLRTLFLLACASAILCARVAAEEPFKEFLAPTPSPRATAIVVHGLNLNPEEMDEIISLLHGLDVDCLLVLLTEHRSDEGNASEASAKTWLGELEQAVTHAKTSMRSPVLIGVGYSMGGTLVAAWQATHNKSGFEKLVLIAPALDLPWKATFLYPILPLRHLGVHLPSLAPENYRFSDSVSLDAYNGLFDLVHIFDEAKNNSNWESPTLVILNETDELVPFDALKNISSSFSNWQIERVTFSQDQSEFYNHLLIKKEALDSASWTAMGNAIESLLKK